MKGGFGKFLTFILGLVVGVLLVGGGGGGYVPTTQKPEIKAAAGGKAELSKDGTTLTITADAGKVIDKVLLNGKDMEPRFNGPSLEPQSRTASQ